MFKTRTKTGSLVSSCYYYLVKKAYQLKSLKHRVKVIHNTADLEKLLQKTEELHANSPVNALSFARSWFFVPYLKNHEANSEEYFAEQRSRYELFSGKPWGTFDLVAQEDDIKFNSLSDLYPYALRDLNLVSTHLQRVGYWLNAMDLPIGSKILEFGAGSGELSLFLAQTGYDVLATDISLKYTSVIAQKAAFANVPLKTEVADMTSYTPDKKFDAVIFCEAFHHSSNHLQLLKTLKKILNPGGRVYLCGEPITYYPYPWGVRTDGESIWMARKYGWLELGFDQSYFRKLVQSLGWRISIKRNKSIDHAAYVICLTKLKE